VTEVRIVEEVPARDGSVSRLVLEEWQRDGGVAAGITTRPGAPTFGLASAPNAVEPIDAYLSLASDVDMEAVSVVVQVHGDRVVDVPDPPPPALACFGRADGLVTKGGRSLLAVTAADCVPIYLYDPLRRAVGILHAGWRGAAAGLLASGVQTLADRCGAAPSDLLIHFGPSISGDRYEVGPEVLREFGLEASGPGMLDLRDQLVRQALEAGIPADHISRSAWCTATHSDLFHSHRASGGTAGRMAAYIGLS